MDIQPDKDPRIDSGNDDHLVGESNRDSDDLKEKGNQRKEGATTEQSRTAVENDGAELARNLEDKVTLIMATSPVKSNPSTVLLKHTMDSIRVYCKGTYKLRKIIVCDGYSTTEEKNQKGVARKGRRIAEDKVADYKEYIRRVQELIEQKEDPAFHKAETLVLPKLHGFGLAMKEALKLVKTPYVFVAQHDRCFSTKATGLDTLVQLLEKEPLVRYVGYLTHRQLNYASRMMSQHQLKVNPVRKQGVLLAPLIHFLDSMHVARVSFWKYMFETGTIKVRSFPEHTFGNVQRWDIVKNGWKAFEKYGTYLLWDANVCVKHINGRTFLDTVQRQRRGFPALGPFAELEDKLKEHDKLSRSVMHTEGGKGEMPKDKETHQTSNEDNGTVMDDER
mmetsp:Transcript_22416/g.36112  ORF Transcript_22416/g.36112 Transcript_22416/m.36112 type:complete len:391 (+) Transcript_22416:78-1250(+)